jgi:integrase
MHAVHVAPAIAKVLRERRLATLYKAATDLVFTIASGRGLDYRHVRHGFLDAVKRAGLQAPGRLSLHSLRHGFASLLLAEGMNVVFVSRQLGHANPTITLGVYAHLFERADHAAAARGGAGGELRGDGGRGHLRSGGAGNKRPAAEPCLWPRT